MSVLVCERVAVFVIIKRIPGAACVWARDEERRKDGGKRNARKQTRAGNDCMVHDVGGPRTRGKKG